MDGYGPYEREVGWERNARGGATAQEDLVNLSRENQAQTYLVSARPTTEQKFSGDGKTFVDFEAHLQCFEVVTSRRGVTDLMKYLELQHWFTGPALEVCSLYDRLKTTCGESIASYICLLSACLRRC